MPDPVTYTGVLPIGEPMLSVWPSCWLLSVENAGLGGGRRALGPWRHAVLVLRWFLDATRVAHLAVDNQISLSTAYRYLHEGIDVIRPLPKKVHCVVGRSAGLVAGLVSGPSGW